MIKNTVFEKINLDWQNQLKPYVNKSLLIQVNQNLEKSKFNSVIFPPENKIFYSLNSLPFDQVNVVIIGQDPYPNEGQANGLAFSVNPGVPLPASLKNIFKEIQIEYNLPLIPQQGDLSFWANQGVLLINSSWTVEKNKPNSHKDFGWISFTRSIIQSLNEQKFNLIFLLWGKHAQSFSKMIDSSKHVIFKTNHPSPLSANKGGWFNSNIFLNTNKKLEELNKKPIQWFLEQN